jgi:hypothetical protein
MAHQGGWTKQKFKTLKKRSDLLRVSDHPVSRKGVKFLNFPIDKNEPTLCGMRCQALKCESSFITIFPNSLSVAIASLTHAACRLPAYTINHG